MDDGDIQIVPKFLMGILNILFLEQIQCIVLVSQEIEVHNLIQLFLFVLD